MKTLQIRSIIVGAVSGLLLSGGGSALAGEVLGCACISPYLKFPSAVSDECSQMAVSLRYGGGRVRAARAGDPAEGQNQIFDNSYFTQDGCHEYLNLVPVCYADKGNKLLATEALVCETRGQDLNP